MMLLKFNEKSFKKPGDLLLIIVYPKKNLQKFIMILLRSLNLNFKRSMSTVSRDNFYSIPSHH